MSPVGTLNQLEVIECLQYRETDIEYIDTNFRAMKLVISNIGVDTEYSVQHCTDRIH